MLSAAEDIISREEHGNSGHQFNSSSPSSFSKTAASEVCEVEISQRHCNLMSTGAVLLADIIPTLVMKLTLPFYMHRIPFGLRHFVVCAAQAISYLIVAFSDSVVVSLVGVAFASFSSGLGESCYLALTSHYSRNTISAWSSGTGGAGIVGAVAYATLTEPHLAHLSPRTALLVMLVVPVVFAIAYWGILTPSPTVHRMKLMDPTSWIVSSEELRNRFPSESSVSAPDTTKHERVESVSKSFKKGSLGEAMADMELSPTFVGKLRLAVPLLKYMIPLSVVFMAEYLANQGVAELIYFDCSHGFWLSKASQYRWYQMLYQLGVFVSRSSVNCLELPTTIVFLLPVLQVFNMLIFFFDAIYAYIPHIALVFGLVFIEGLFGGAAYVNTFNKVHAQVPIRLKEYSLSVVTLADSVGIVVAGFTSIPVHNWICSLDVFRKSH